MKTSSRLALKAVGLYCVAASVWIAASDLLLGFLVRDPAWLTRLQTYKGLAFVVVTSLILFGLLEDRFRTWEKEVAKRKTVEADLRRSERLKADLINNLDGIVWEADATTFQFTFVSKQAERLLGYPVARWTGEKTFWRDHLHPEDREEAVRYCQEQAGRGLAHDFEYRMIAADGRTVWLRDLVTVEMDNGVPTRLRGVMVDATQRKRLEAEAARNEERLDAFFINAPAGLAILDTELRFARLNDTVARVNGIPMADHLGRTIDELLPGLATTARPLLAGVLATGRPQLNVEISGETPSQPGVQRHWMESFFPLAGPEGKTDGVGVIFVEITEMRRTARELQSKTAFLEAQVESAIDGILVVDSHGRKLLQNRRMNELWSIPPDVAENPDDAGQLEFVAHQTKNPEAFTDKVAYLYAHPDEVSRDEIELVNGTALERYSSPVRDRSGTHYGRIWTFRDITQRRQLEEQLRQSQKMEAIGRLAGGVAHDFNNILAVIQLQAGLLKMDPATPAALLAVAAEIEQGASRGATLTRQLLLFSRGQEWQPADLDLGELITNIAQMLRRILGEDVRMNLQLSDDRLVVHGDRSMLDQTILNLTVNARDAMPRGGELLITTVAVDLDEAAAAGTPGARAGKFACLSVTDTGCGIPPENLPRIFEPFFSTKDVGKGTGLGLATVFGVVQKHQGWVEVESRVGLGSTFRIYLPRLDRAAATEAGPPTAAAEVVGGRETILLVEDDPLLRSSARTILSQLGYTVREASDGVEALGVWRRFKGEVSLLLTDLVMPGGLNGKEVAQRLLAENPHLQVIYTSGFSQDVVGRDPLLLEGVNFLPKPFEARKLTHIVRLRLDQSRG